MTRRLELHEILCDALGSRNVYFQPPENIKMKYPSIVYHRNSIVNSYSNDNVYNQRTSYMITVIDGNPDSSIVENISKLPTCRHTSNYRADGLNHDTFIIYY